MQGEHVILLAGMGKTVTLHKLQRVSICYLSGLDFKLSETRKRFRSWLQSTDYGRGICNENRMKHWLWIYATASLNSKVMMSYQLLYETMRLGVPYHRNFVKLLLQTRLSERMMDEWLHFDAMQMSLPGAQKDNKLHSNKRKPSNPAFNNSETMIFYWL